MANFNHYWQKASKGTPLGKGGVKGEGMMGG